MGQGIVVVYLYNSIYTLPLSLIWCSSYYISTPHMGQNPFRRSAHPFPSHFPVHRAWEESFPRSTRPDRPPPDILPYCACFVFSQKGKCCWPWSGVSPRGNCELFGRLPLRHSARPSASCLGSAATLSTAVFSLYQTRDGSAAIAGRCRRRLHTLRFVRMSPSSTRSATDHVRVGGDRRRCRA